MLKSRMKALAAMVNGKRFVVRADEKLTAFLELESAILRGQLNAVRTQEIVNAL